VTAGAGRTRREAARPARQEAKRPARQETLRRHNLALVLGEVAVHGPLSRAQVAAATGLTKGTVSSLVDDLVAAGLVRTLAPTRGAVGRPGNPLALDPGGPVGVGLEIDVDYTRVAVVDLTGDVRQRRVEVADHRTSSPEASLASAAALVRDVVHAATRQGHAVAGLGVAVPGLVDTKGLLRLAPNLPGWESTPVLSVLHGHLDDGPDGLPADAHTALDNEANLAALGEQWFGGHPDLRDFVYVSGEIGVGAGIVTGGAVFRGVSGYAGELGHVPVDPDGPACGCGGRGCLEQVAGQEALLRAAGVPVDAGTTTAAPDGSVATLRRRADGGDREALRALEAAGHALGVAVSALVNVVDVPTVVLGGLYAALAPWLRGPLTAELGTRVVASSWAPTQVLVSTLGPDAAVRGAAGTVLRHILDDPEAYVPAPV
jgi:predicted NBD/HSP70 family sugar kinase